MFLILYCTVCLKFLRKILEYNNNLSSCKLISLNEGEPWRNDKVAA